jgi:hypothetical protein
MNAPIYFQQDRVVDDAFAIAWNFVKQTGNVADPYNAQVFLSREIMRLIGKGETNKIRIANLAIASFERENTVFRQSA